MMKRSLAIKLNTFIIYCYYYRLISQTNKFLNHVKIFRLNHTNNAFCLMLPHNHFKDVPQGHTKQSCQFYADLIIRI